MNTLLKTIFYMIAESGVVRFWANPQHSMEIINDIRIERMLQKLKVYNPGFPSDDPPPEAPSEPSRSFPTDVPAPEPHDVPVPEPQDVPPPEPGNDPMSRPIQ